MNTMSTRVENMRANFDIMDFELGADEMLEIDALTAANFRISNADVVPYAPTWD
jgi:2,5-diketo-D-gluconate reductase B